MLLVSIFCRSSDFLLYTLSEALVVLVVCARFELLDDGAGREAPLRVGRHNRGSGRNVVRLRSGFLRLDVDAEGVILRLVAADDLSSGRAIDGQNEAAAVVLEDYEETKKELADWVNASPEELADVIAGM